MAKKKRANPEINSSSMADIAFLLLIFFLVTTTIANDRGILMQLPPKPDDMEDIEIKLKEHNLFKVYINSADRLLVEGEPLSDIYLIRDMVKEHVLNKFDHKNLNLDVAAFKDLNPTAENIAIVTYKILRPLIKENYELKIKLYETPRNFVEYPY